MHSNSVSQKKAVLVGIQTPKISDQDMESSLQELSRLVSTMGAKVIGQMSQRRSSERTVTVLGDGKLKELAKWTGGPGVIGPLFVKKKHKAALKFDSQDEPEEEIEDLDTSSDKTPDEQAQIVVFDCELSPSQLRNLESATGATVFDRTGVIIEIFSRHARTRASKLQVEIARLAYLAPRIRETGGEDRQEGGGGKGSGEKAIELDRRNIRDRIKELKEELSSIAHEQDQRRTRRSQELTVALVGYTNAGKSSLMRALTGSDVLVQDKLFATLDTTVRALYPESRPKILISDTVGFIKKLPHDLVASFKSTLDEALSASLLLFVVDASDATFRSQLKVTESTLAEVGITEEVPSLLVLNKIDRLLPDTLTALKEEFPDGVFLSAKNPEDIKQFRLKIIGQFEEEMSDETLFIPYTVQGIIGEIRSKMRVISESYNELGQSFVVRAKPEDIQRLKARYKID